MKRFPMTVRGAERLREELQQLRIVERPKVINAIAEARAHGDLRENAEYHAAKEQQSFMEGRISELEERLGNAELIDPSALNARGRVVFGATVELENADTQETVRYQIVGDLEADVESGLISISSPIARALIGKEEGDIATVNAPAGEVEYEIVAVEYV
jgi:transcription elongation factor GreA